MKAQMSQLLKLYIYCSMNKQYAEGGQNGEKSYLIRLGKW